MARYSVATTRNNLSRLIDRAMAGEEVVITRHGKPAVALKVVDNVKAAVDTEKRRAWLARLDRFRRTMPSGRLTALEHKRRDQDEWEGRLDH